jgi:hypothetical protein
VLLVLFSVLPLSRERVLGRLVALRDQRAYWGAHGLLAAAYAVLYLVLTGGPDGQRSPPGDWWTVTVEAVRTVTVALVGGPWRGVGDMPVAAHLAPPAGVALAVAVVAAGFVGWTVVRGGGAALDAWLVLVAYLALDIALLVSARGALAPFLASDPRYYADAAPVAALALALALRAVQDRDVARPVRVAAPGARGRLRAAAVLVAAAVFAGGSLVTTIALGQQAERYSARGYVDRMRGALRAEPDVTLADSPAAPVAIVEAFLGGQASVAQVLAPLPEADRLTRPGRRLRVFDREGRLVAGILLGRVFADAGPDGDCGYQVSDQPRAVPLAGPPRTYVGHVKVSYFTGTTRPGAITVAGRRHRVVFEEGVHDWWVPVDGRLDEVVVDAPAEDNALCLTAVEAGRAWPPAD